MTFHIKILTFYCQILTYYFKINFVWQNLIFFFLLFWLLVSHFDFLAQNVDFLQNYDILLQIFYFYLKFWNFSSKFWILVQNVNLLQNFYCRFVASFLKILTLYLEIWLNMSKKISMLSTMRKRGVLPYLVFLYRCISTSSFFFVLEH